MTHEPDFGNWIRLRRVVAILSVGVLVLSAAFITPSPWCWLVVSAGAPLLATGIYLAYVYYAFDDRGGGLQRKLWHITLSHINSYERLIGHALDIGTGNGSLAIICAMDNPNVTVIGVDLWDPEWEYSQNDCEANARRAGVEQRCTFQQASAHALPFTNEAFDCVMSHFVFHEVAPAADKRQVVIEALRVLKPGGTFSLHDMFFNGQLYGDPAELVEFIRATGVKDIQLIDSRKLVNANPLLMNKRTLGHCGILCGTK